MTEWKNPLKDEWDPKIEWDIFYLNRDWRSNEKIIINKFFWSIVFNSTIQS